MDGFGHVECSIKKLLFIFHCEHSHLRRRPNFGIVGANGFECDCVTEFFYDGLCPGLELVACPFEAMVEMAKVSSGKGRPAYVVFSVGCCDDDGVGMGIFEDDAFEG